MAIIQNGTLGSSQGTQRADLALDGGKIQQIAPRLPPRPGDEVVSAEGLLVFPGLVGPETMCAILAENPAKYGMWPQKGCLAQESDADLILWDPKAQWTVSAAAQHQKVDYTPYEGMVLTGRAKAVYLDGAPVRTGLGRYISPTTIL